MSRSPRSLARWAEEGIGAMVFEGRMERLKPKSLTVFLPSRRWWLFAALALGLLVPVAVATESPRITLTLVGQKGEVFLRTRVRSKDLLWMGFTHSSEHVRVASAFHVVATEFQPVETRMEGFGPGLSPRAKLVSGNQLLTREGQAYRKLVLLVTPSTSHWLAVGGKRLDLSKRVPKSRHAYRFTLSLEQSGWTNFLNSFSS